MIVYEFNRASLAKSLVSQDNIFLLLMLLLYSHHNILKTRHKEPDRRCMKNYNLNVFEFTHKMFHFSVKLL